MRERDPEESASFDKETIARGLPNPGGDVPEWTWTEGDPLSAVACGGPENLPSQPTASFRVEVSPPDENAWRHLLVFGTEQAASDALEAAAILGGRLQRDPRHAGRRPHRPLRDALDHDPPAGLIT